MRNTTRRRFIGIAAGLVGASTACSRQADTEGQDAGDGDGDGDCSATPADIEGPFYRDGIPVRNNLDLYGDAGVRLELAGVVVDESCTPQANVVIEFWHASPVAPAGQPGDLDASYDGGDELRYYGQTATDEQGRYSLTTLIPGWYLNGAQYRPAHIHVKVWVGQNQRLTTQLYFDADPFNAIDPWFNPATMLTPDTDGNARFDIAI